MIAGIYEWNNNNIITENFRNFHIQLILQFDYHSE
jgi:hypothetical protein